MPRGQARVFKLPPRLKTDTLSAEAFRAVQAAAKVAGIHPDILEMGRRLLGKVGVEAGVFTLGNDELRKRGDELRDAFHVGLRKVAKALGPGGLAVKHHRDGDRLVFWYAPAVGGRKAAKASR